MGKRKSRGIKDERFIVNQAEQWSVMAYSRREREVAQGDVQQECNLQTSQKSLMLSSLSLRLQLKHSGLEPIISSKM